MTDLLIQSHIFYFLFVVSMAKNYKVVQRSGIGEHYSFAWKVFTSWDYAVTDVKTVEVRLKNHAVGLREALFETKKQVDHKGTLEK